MMIQRPLWVWLVLGVFLILGIATWFGLPTPALAAVHPALTGVLVVAFAFVMLLVRWRQNAGFISAPEAVMAAGLMAAGASGASAAGGSWPSLMSLIGILIVGVGAIGGRIQNGRPRRSGNPT